MCDDKNYCNKKEHSLREYQGYDGDICPYCFQELEEEVINLRKMILELDETIYFLNEKIY